MVEKVKIDLCPFCGGGVSAKRDFYESVFKCKRCAALMVFEGLPADCLKKFNKRVAFEMNFEKKEFVIDPKDCANILKDYQRAMEQQIERLKNMNGVSQALPNYNHKTDFEV